MLRKVGTGAAPAPACTASGSGEGNSVGLPMGAMLIANEWVDTAPLASGARMASVCAPTASVLVENVYGGAVSVTCGAPSIRKSTLEAGFQAVQTPSSAAVCPCARLPHVPPCGALVPFTNRLQPRNSTVSLCVVLATSPLVSVTVTRSVRWPVVSAAVSCQR